MEIYIEYAFLENFLFDGILLFLSLKAANLSIKWKKLLFSAACGGVFAVVFPLLVLPNSLAYVLKFSVGFLICMFAVGRIKSKNEWGRYALSVILFFSFSFGFGGALLGISDGFRGEHAPTAFVMLGFSILTAFSLFLIRKLRERRAIYRCLYDCQMQNQGKKTQTSGFLDSGNLAMKNGLPVCFVSPDLIYELFEEEILKGWGQVCDELVISTLGGERKTPVYKGEITVKTERGRIKREVYFAPSQNMLTREYKILLNGRIFDGCSEEKE